MTEKTEGWGIAKLLKEEKAAQGKARATRHARFVQARRAEAKPLILIDQPTAYRQNAFLEKKGQYMDQLVEGFLKDPDGQGLEFLNFFLGKIKKAGWPRLRLLTQRVLMWRRKNRTDHPEENLLLKTLAQTKRAVKLKAFKP